MQAETNPTSAATIQRLRQWLAEQVIQGLQIKPPEESPEVAARHLLTAAYQRSHLDLPAPVVKELFEDILGDALGYGPIQPLLDDSEVTEIMVNGPEQVYVERNGRIALTDVRFRDSAEVLRLIDRIIRPLGRRIEPDNPTVDARLPDGSRVNAVIPPAAIDGPCVTVRKFARERLRIPPTWSAMGRSPHR